MSACETILCVSLLVPGGDRRRVQAGWGDPTGGGGGAQESALNPSRVPSSTEQRMPDHRTSDMKTYYAV